MAETVNTTETIKKVVEKSDLELTRELRNLEKQFGDKKDWVEITMPELIANSIGNPYYGSYNGVAYTLIAGEKIKLPKAIVDHLQNVFNNAK